MEEEIGVFLVVSSCYRSQEVKARGDNLMWLYTALFKGRNGDALHLHMGVRTTGE